jgi:hypothetical protein
MVGPYPDTVSDSNTVPLDTHAAATLRYIRESMDAAGTVAVPGSAGIVMGFIGLAAAVAASTEALRPHWLPLWLGAAVLASGAGGILLARQSSRQGSTLLGAPARKFLLCLLPGLFAGAVMTAIHWRAGNLHAIPGTWLLSYGCALVSTGALTDRLVGILGALFVALGLIAFALPDSLQTVALGSGFGELHLLFGILIRSKGNGTKVWPGAF